VARTYVVLTAQNVRTRCLYLLPNALLCFRQPDIAVTDTLLPANYQNYQVCLNHFEILQATDQAKFTSSGSQLGDQVINTTLISDDVNYWTPANKDSRNKGNTQKQYVSEINHP